MSDYTAIDKEVKENIEKACEYIAVEFTKLLDVKCEYNEECARLIIENNEMHKIIKDALKELDVLTDKLNRITETLDYADSNPALAIKLIRMIMECPF